jgi:nanoRNase/pAp phosphatase (c-di-AMP/oligoRNAs hydrolase)
MSIEQILQLPDVKERADMFFEHEGKFRDQLKRCSKLHGNLVILDLRDEEIIYAGNRFMIYALFPRANISIHVLWGLKQQNTVFATGKSILNRTSRTNIGDLMLEYGGGGHEAAGTCQVANEEAAAVLAKLVARINADG